MRVLASRSSSSTIPSPGVSGKGDHALRVGAAGLGQHVVAPVEVPFRRVVGVFEIRRVGQARGQMRVGDQADPVAPSVRREVDAELRRHHRDPAQPGDPADQRGIGLQHVEAPLLDQVAELIQLARHLAAGDPDVHGVAQPPHALAVAAMQRLLHPVDAQQLQLAGDRNGVLQRPGRVGVLRQAPALVAIHHQLHAVADAGAHRLERLDVVAPIAALEPDLQRGEPGGPIALRRVGHRRGIAQRAGRGVGADLVAQPAQQLPARLAGRLAREIPQREVERPAAAVMELQVVERAVMPLDRQRILADEQVLVPGEAEHEVARADAGDALVGVDPHDGRSPSGGAARCPRRRGTAAKRPGGAA